MRSALLILSILFATGCACPDYEGVDGELSFRTCADPSAPLMRGSSFAIDASPDQDVGAATWSADDAVLTVATGDEAGSFTAEGVGQGTITLTAEDGRTDSLEYEVAEPASVVWQDPWWNTTQDLLVDDNDQYVVGAPAASHPGDTLRLFNGGATDVTVDVLDAAGRSLQWSSAAIVYAGAAENPDGFNGIVRGPGMARAETADGVELGSLEVVAVDSLEGATLNLAAWAPPREVPDENPETYEWQSYLRAVVVDTDGEPVFGAPIVWTVAGAGTVSTWEDEDSDDQPRRDIATLLINFDDGHNKSACVTAAVEGAGSVSVFLSADGNSVHDDGDCGGQAACAGCTTVGSRDSAWLGLLALAALIRRRR